VGVQVSELRTWRAPSPRSLRRLWGRQGLSPSESSSLIHSTDCVIDWVMEGNGGEAGDCMCLGRARTGMDAVEAAI
jgi:hypothetical protein